MFSVLWQSGDIYMRIICQPSVFWRQRKTVVFEMDCLLCISNKPLEANGRSLVNRRGERYHLTVRRHAHFLLAALIRGGVRVAIWSHHTYRRVRCVVRLCFPDVKFAFLRGRRRCVVFGETYVKPCKFALVDFNPAQADYDATRRRGFMLQCTQCTQSSVADDELRRLSHYLCRLTAIGNRPSRCRV